MNREQLLVGGVLVVAIFLFLSNTEINRGMTGFMVKEFCGKEYQKVREQCGGTGDEKAPGCLSVNYEYRKCLAITGQENQKHARECGYIATGRKRCNSARDNALHNQVLKEMRDPANTFCKPLWLTEKSCGVGEICASGECVGKPCASSIDCVKYGGRACHEGRCVLYCEDSDEKNKDNEFKKGRTISLVGRKKVEEDFCFNQDTLIEWFCDPTYDVNRPGVKYINYDKVFCDSGCSQGACKKP